MQKRKVWGKCWYQVLEDEDNSEVNIVVFQFNYIGIVMFVYLLWSLCLIMMRWNIEACLAYWWGFDKWLRYILGKWLSKVFWYIWFSIWHGFCGSFPLDDCSWLRYTLDVWWQIHDGHALVLNWWYGTSLYLIDAMVYGTGCIHIWHMVHDWILIIDVVVGISYCSWLMHICWYTIDGGYGSYFSIA
jgi:hypothetical protein